VEKASEYALDSASTVTTAVLDLMDKLACWSANASAGADPNTPGGADKAASKSAAGPKEDRHLQGAAVRLEN
jgi:hypothetical protein